MNKKQISELARGLQALSHKAQIKKYGGKKGYKEEMKRRASMKRGANKVIPN